MRKENTDFFSIDDTDLQILSLLQKNARISIKHIAEQTFLSPTAISARIEKLEKGGYIEGYYAHINAQAFGFNIKAFINLEVEPVQKKEFYPYIRSCRDGRICDADRGSFPNNSGIGSLHRRTSTFRKDKNANRVFDFRRTQRCLFRASIILGSLINKGKTQWGEVLCFYSFNFT